MCGGGGGGTIACCTLHNCTHPHYTSSVPKFYTFEWDGMPILSVHLPTTNKQSRSEVHVVIKNSKKACMYNNISYSESSPYVPTLMESLKGPVVTPLGFAATMIV